MNGQRTGIGPGRDDQDGHAAAASLCDHRELPESGLAPEAAPAISWASRAEHAAGCRLRLIGSIGLWLLAVAIYLAVCSYVVYVLAQVLEQAIRFLPQQLELPHGALVSPR
jgi:hypothetical protein